MALTIEDVFEYVGIEPEYADEVQTRRAKSALASARLWLVGAVGKRHDLDEPYAWLEWPQAEEAMLMACGEMYENRNLVDVNLSKYAGSKAAASLNRLAFDIITQLRFCDFSDLPKEEAPEDPPEDAPSPPDGEGGGTSGEGGERCPSETP